jgi:hypothetical protein
MGKKQTKPTSPPISRRTGIDRRWITTAIFYPERRSGKDRRSTSDRSFLSSIDSEDQRDHIKTFSDGYTSDDGLTEADTLEGAISEKPLPRSPGTALADRTGDD